MLFQQKQLLHIQLVTISSSSAMAKRLIRDLIDKKIVDNKCFLIRIEPLIKVCNRIDLFTSSQKLKI